MSDSTIDPDLAVAVVTAIVALIYLVLAVRAFRSGSPAYGAARLFAAVLFGAVAYFFAFFQMRLF